MENPLRRRPSYASGARSPSTVRSAPTGPTSPIARSEVVGIWEKALLELGDMTADMAREYEKLELQEANKLVVTLKDSYNRDMCNRPERKSKLESTLTKIAGQQLRVDFLVAAGEQKRSVAPPPKLTRRQQIRQLHDRPWVKKAMEVFDADITDYREPR